MTDVLLQAVQEFQGGFMQAFDTLVEALQDDITQKSVRYCVPGYDREDVEQELLMALREAACGYDPTKGASFRTYYWLVADRHIQMLQRALGRDKRKANLEALSLQGLTDTCDEYEANEPWFLGECDTGYGDVELFADLDSAITLRERVVIRMKMDGYDNRDINDVIGGTVYTKSDGTYNGCEVDRILRRLKKKVTFLLSAC